MDCGYSSLEKRQEMPRVFLSEVLQVRCRPLNECELWSVLCQSVEVIQDLFLSAVIEVPLNKTVITPSSLAFVCTGKVEFVTSSCEDGDVEQFVPPEFEAASDLDEDCLEKILIFSLGQTLKYAANYPDKLIIPNENSINLSPLLNSTLNSMCQADVGLRNNVLSILEIISHSIHRFTESKPFTYFICSLYREVLGFNICEETAKDFNLFSNQRVNRSESVSTICSEKYGKRLGYFPRYTKKMPKRSNSDATPLTTTKDSNNQLDLTVDRKRLVEILQLDVDVPEMKAERFRSKSLADVNSEEMNNFSKVRVKNSLQNIPSKIESQCDKKMILARPTFGSTKYDVENYPQLFRCMSSVRKTPKNIIGPEFVVMSSKPNLPLDLNVKNKEMLGNAKHLKEIIIVLLNGQRLETNCDVSVTKVEHLWEAIVTHEKFNRKFLYGLAYIKDGEFIFLEAEQKLQKIVSSGWTEWRGHNQMDITSFTVYVRVKFYIDHKLFRDKMSRHLHYLQLRRDILEERIRCDPQKSIYLASLALQAEFGDYDETVFGKDYFILDHYVSPSAVKYFGAENAKRQLVALHRARKGLSNGSAENEFFEEIEKLSDYGFHFHTIQEGKKSKNSKPICVGISTKGIGLFGTNEKRERQKFFEWKTIQRITYDEKHLYLTIIDDNSSQQKEKLKFHTDKTKNRYLFHIATAHHRLHLMLDCNIQVPDPSFQDIIGLKLENGSESHDEISYELKRDADQSGESKTSFEFEQIDENDGSAFVLGTSFGPPKNMSQLCHEEINDSLASRFDNLGNASVNERRLVATTLHRSPMHGFGLSVAMGDDQGIYIQSIFPQSPAELSRVLEQGDRIFSVNQILVDCMEYEHVLDLIRECKDKIDIVVSQQIPGHELSTIKEELEMSTLKTSDPENETEIDTSDINASCFDSVTCNGKCEIIKYQKFVEQLQNTKENRSDSSTNASEEAIHDESVEKMRCGSSEEPTDESPFNADAECDDVKSGDIFHVVLEKNGGSLGINIKGGVNSSGTEKNIFVQQVIPGGAAALDGRIKVGDVILEVNGSNLTNATHQEAVDTLRTTSPLAHLTLRRGAPNTLLRVRSTTATHPHGSTNPFSPQIRRHVSLKNENTKSFKTTIQLNAGCGGSGSNSTMNANSAVRRNSSDNWGTRISFGNESANVIRLRVNFEEPGAPGPLGPLRRSLSTDLRRRSSLEWVPATDSTVKVMSTRGVGNRVYTHTPVCNYEAEHVDDEGFVDAKSRTALTTHVEEESAPKSVDGGERAALQYKARAATDPLLLGSLCGMAELGSGENGWGGAGRTEVEDEEVPVQEEYPFINDENTFDVKLVKNSRGLGLSVCGGWDADPTDSIARLIRIKRLYPLQPAVQSGKLEIGDILLAVNRQPVLGLMYFEAIEILRMASNPIVLTICRPEAGAIPPIPQSSSLLATALCDERDSVPRYNGPSYTEFDVTLTKIGGSLGFTLVKMEGPNAGHYIKALVKDPALSDGQLQPGDKIILVNGTDVSDMSHSESIKLLRELPDEVTLCVWRQVVLPSSPASPSSPTAPAFPEESWEKKAKPKILLRKEALDMLNDKSRPKGCRKTLNGASPLASPRIRRKQLADGGCADADSSPKTHADAEAARDTHLRVGSNVSSSRSTSESSTSGIDKGTSSSDRSFSSPVLIPGQGAASDVAGSPESPGKPQRPSYLDLNAENLSPRKQKFGRAPHRREPMKEEDLMGDEEESEESSYIRYFDSGDSFLATDDGLTTVTSSEDSPVQVGGHSALLKWRGAKLASQEDIGDISEESEDGSRRVERTSSIITVDLHREGNSRLGLSLVSMETNDAPGIYVKVVYPGSLADADGRVQVGDKLLQINETDVKGMSVDEVIDLLRNQNGRVSLVLEREIETLRGDDIKNRDTSSLGRSWSEQENLLSNEVSLLNAKNNNLSSADCLHWNAMTSDGNENENRANDS